MKVNNTILCFREYKSMFFDKPVIFIPNYYDKLGLITLIKRRNSQTQETLSS